MLKYYSIWTDEDADATILAIQIKHFVEGDSFLYVNSNVGPELLKLRRLLAIE